MIDLIENKTRLAVIKAAARGNVSNDNLSQDQESVNMYTNEFQGIVKSEGVFNST